MKIDFPNSAKPAIEVSRRIREAGGEAFLIGGCVRDIILGKEPKDYDVATSMRPDDLQKIFPKAKETGKSFGVIRVRSSGEEIEVATFRRDGPYSDGRRPDFVEFTDLKEDILRRDFTVNALAADVESGEVIDYVEGIRDLNDKIIRCVGEPERRFDEDKLRLIRATRFAHVLGFEIEPKTWHAIQRRAEDITTVAMERVADELTKTITHVPAGNAIRTLDDVGLLTPLLPEVTLMKGVEQPPEFHPEGDCYVHTCILMDKLKPNPSPAVAWAALLHDIGKPATYMVTDRIRFHGHAELGAKMSRRIGRRFRFSNQLIDRIHIIILEHQKYGDVDKMRPGRLKNWAGKPHFEELLEVHRADCAASHEDMSAYEKSCEVLEEIRREEALPDRIVTGHTLMELGLKPGPKFREILELAYEAQLEDAFSENDSGKSYVREKILPEVL